MPASGIHMRPEYRARVQEGAYMRAGADYQPPPLVSARSLRA
jgi:hypothetical protein